MFDSFKEIICWVFDRGTIMWECLSSCSYEIIGKNHCSRVDMWEGNIRSVVVGSSRRMNAKWEWFITRRRNNSNRGKDCWSGRDTTRGKDCCRRKENQCSHVRVYILGACRVHDEEEYQVYSDAKLDNRRTI